MLHEGVTFNYGQVDLDGNEFVRCTFNNAELIYRGTGTVTLHENNLNNVKWTFAGPAASTVNFMSAIYNNAGTGGRKLIEETFNLIRFGGFQETKVG